MGAVGAAGDGVTAGWVAGSAAVTGVAGASATGAADGACTTGVGTVET